ncbi:7886_t:CDS:2 [Funneliformis geosporum]|uniref:1882_t:CDS:1 n=1 Tax=Funneliformis geosporum TaxID=1117311 RepID=A0A9W4SHL5_9GLOM|nr:7886_t:CDS:2 [Funneliformis geosporum]CAI2169763.1 1882_t:CDS:2 [Funneliformis geosporum]
MNNKSKKRHNANSEQSESRDSKHPRIKVSLDDSVMDVDSSSLPSLSPFPSPLPSSCPSPVSFSMDYSQETVLQYENEVSSELNKMHLNNIREKDMEVCEDPPELKRDFASVASNALKGTHCIAQSFEEFCPIIKIFLSLGNEIVTLYEKAEHNKQLCSALLQRCNCAIAAVKDLNIRKTENMKFFSRQENLSIFKDFIKCIKKIRNFIKDISQLNKLQRFIHTSEINDSFNKITKEFDGYMYSLNFSFTMQSRDELATIQQDVSQMKDILLYVHGVTDNQQGFLSGMDLVAGRNKEFKKQNRFNPNTNSSELRTTVEANEPLLEGSCYLRTIPNKCPSRRIEKRTCIKDCTDVSFKEFSNNTSSDDVQTQIEIRRQVNILKELKNSDHIIRFFGVAQEESKYYLVTEWMEFGNLYEYYTEHRENMKWETKIRFALDICRGVAYLHECEVDYDTKCEIYSVGALLWEIAELKKPHSDLDKSEILGSIRKRIQEKYYEPFSDDVPGEWKHIVSRAMEYEPAWRSTISSICRDLYKLAGIPRQFTSPNSIFENEVSTPNYSSESYKENISTNNNQSARFSSPITFTILPVEDAIREHKSSNGNKLVAWNSFKFHSVTNVEARYWVGYYYFYHGEDIPELRPITKEERTKNAVDIFKETADKGNTSAQLRYGMHLWQKENNYVEGFKYLEMSANSKDATAMFIVGKAYWNGINGIVQDKVLGAQYLKCAALEAHPKAQDLCNEYRIS